MSVFRKSDGRYWARRSQHERIRPTKEMLRRRKQKKRVSTYDAGVPPDRPP